MSDEEAGQVAEIRLEQLCLREMTLLTDLASERRASAREPVTGEALCQALLPEWPEAFPLRHAA